jgi:hypothetical protein
MDSSRMSSDRSLTDLPSDRVRSYIRPVGGGTSLLAKMDSRAPRAIRGAGLKGQGCYRPDAVSARPMGHLSRRSLSISTKKVIGDSFTGR